MILCPFILIAHVESHGDFHVIEAKGIYRESESKLAAQIQPQNKNGIACRISPNRSRRIPGQSGTPHAQEPWIK
jgi:hypothetical protein